MATESIFDNIIIRTPEEAENFVRAVEEAQRLAEEIPLKKVPVKRLTKEECREFFKDFRLE